jgi:hypothetical protein
LSRSDINEWDGVATSDECDDKLSL